jgi:BirA family biotin operon repressor/biotin-[acetyl-CoA-carboxylase] ligase
MLTGMSSTTETTTLYAVQKKLQTRRFGKRIIFRNVVNSTNEWAKELAHLGIEEGAVMVAGQQTAGRGRYGREWFSPKGGLWFSLVLRPEQTVSWAAKLVFVASLAVANVLHEKYGLRTEIKWPNDVLVGNRKICGILVETRSSTRELNFVILGVGINANVHCITFLPVPIESTATSVQDELGRKIQLSRLLQAVLEELEIFYDLFIASGFQSILTRWKTYANFIGHEVVITEHGEAFCGMACDIDEDGELVLRLKDGSLRQFHSGTVSMSKQTSS